MKLNIAHIESESYIYAPGKQFVIWVQGCTLRCKGCWNSEMWDIATNRQMEVAELFSAICRYPENSGVTILGGEPFEQSEPVLELARKIKNRNLGLTIYTGYEMDELTGKYQTELMQYVDLIHTGRYMQSKRNINIKWTGCENKKTFFLTDFYKCNTEYANYCEIQIKEDGTSTLLGFPEKELRNLLLDIKK